MKVIAAGFPKTGTKSIAQALRILGYDKVYDYEESLEFGFEEWEKVFSDETMTVDEVITKVYSQGVEAVVDLPHSFFFEHFLRRWPDAKVLLSIRDEESQFESFKNMLEEAESSNRILSTIVPMISPTSRRFTLWHKNMLFSILGSYKPKKGLWIEHFRRHQNHVKAVVPKEQLLIYNVKEGWKPLCEFLGKEIPEENFPALNKAGSEERISQKILKKCAIVQRVKREATLGFLLISVAVCLVISFILSRIQDKII